MIYWSDIKYKFLAAAAWSQTRFAVIALSKFPERVRKPAECERLQDSPTATRNSLAKQANT